MSFLVFFGVMMVIVIVIAIVQESRRIAAIPPGPDHDASILHGAVNPALICPHCQTKGRVHTKRVTRKQGVSGGKATAALLTGGLSLLATGLSRKGQVTQAFCGQCRSIWDF